jgi:hypothetical protein
MMTALRAVLLARSQIGERLYNLLRRNMSQSERTYTRSIDNPGSGWYMKLRRGYGL